LRHVVFGFLDVIFTVAALLIDINDFLREQVCVGDKKGIDECPAFQEG